MDNTKQTLKSILPYIIIGILIVILSFIMKDCEHKPNLVLTPNDSINTAIAEKEQIIDYIKNDNANLKAKIDSLKTLKPKVIVRYKTVYDSLLIVDTMCVQALNTLHNEHSKVDSVNNAIISNQETHIMNDSQIIGNLTDIIAIQKHRISTDSVEIEYLNLTVKKEKRKGKLRTILGSAIGVLTGIGISKIIR